MDMELSTNMTNDDIVEFLETHQDISAYTSEELDTLRRMNMRSYATYNINMQLPMMMIRSNDGSMFNTGISHEDLAVHDRKKKK